MSKVPLKPYVWKSWIQRRARSQGVPFWDAAPEPWMLADLAKHVHLVKDLVPAPVSYFSWECSHLGQQEACDPTKDGKPNVHNNLCRLSKWQSQEEEMDAAVGYQWQSLDVLSSSCLDRHLHRELSDTYVDPSRGLLKQITGPSQPQGLS